MKEIKGELWSYYGRPNHVVCVTTNGNVKSDGSLVMGRGCALEARKLSPGIACIWGSWVKQYGNKPNMVTVTGRNPGQMMSFPTKHNYWEPSDLGLIKASAKELAEVAKRYPDTTFILPRPWCGNGRRDWDEVKPLLVGLPDNVLIISKE